MKQEPETATVTAKPEKQENYPNLLTGGVKGNKGGGRHTNEFRALCRSMTDKNELVQVVVDIASGKDEDPRDRLAAIKLLWSYGYGTPKQHIEHEGEIKGGSNKMVIHMNDPYAPKKDSRN